MTSATPARAEAERAIHDALAQIDNHVEVMRDMLTNTVSYTADIRRRLDAMKAKEERAGQ